MKAVNPVLPGFNPDPSLVRVGEDYYIATSTFEWFPGVCIHHSRDLVNWEIISYALADETMLDLRGIDHACGIWAPNLTWSDGLFYLAYTVVYTNRARYKDTCNYLTTATDVHGPWSAPVALSRSGFDPSIFHDTDGRKYLVNMTIDHRPDRVRFSGIDVQEYDPKEKRLLGDPVRVFRGTARGTTEGPNILKKDGWYYLVLAEGGTEFGHCASVARARSLYGPYEESPINPLITSFGQKDCPFERAGHAQLIEGTDGRWYMAHLCSRPLDMCSILGRETAIQNIVWTQEGWPKLEDNDCACPSRTFAAPAEVYQCSDHTQRVDFADGQIPLDYMTLRQGREACGITIEDGQLAIRGGFSPVSRYSQGFLARRQQSLRCDFETRMHFVPRHLNHLAGMLVYYNCDNHYFLKMTRDEHGFCLLVSSLINQALCDSVPVYLPEGTAAVDLKAEIRERTLHFYYRTDTGEWLPVGSVLDMRNISDERVDGNGFTGSMLGVCCCDCQGDGVQARFDVLDYREII